MKINDEGTSNAAHWHERAMKAESRLAEAEALLRRHRHEFDWHCAQPSAPLSAPAYLQIIDRIDAYLSREQPRCSATLGNAGQCYKPEGHDGQHSLFDASIPSWEQP